MVTKEQFSEWKELPVTQEFFKWLNHNLIFNRINMFNVLQEPSKLNSKDFDLVKIMYADNEQIFSSIIKVDVGTINTANIEYDKAILNYKKELKEVFDVD